MQVKKCMPRGFWDRLDMAIIKAKRLGWSQTEMSRRAGYGSHMLSNCREERTVPSVLILWEVCKCSGYSLDWLMKGY